MTTYWDGNTSQEVFRDGDTSRVIMGHGYHDKGASSCVVQNTGNGYIAKFPAHNCTTQDYYVCLDYGQAYDLVLALSAFKKEMGFK